MTIQEFFRIFGCIMIVIYLFFGLDDLIWYIWSILSVHFGKDREGRLELSFEELRDTPPKMLAVCIAAWHEDNVILDVITNFLNTTDYPKSMYHLFIGVYPNDPSTIEAVEEAGRRYPNVHAVINCIDGPTTKAQNINHVIREIKKFEAANGIRFASLTVHDSEDAIHTYELLTTNYLIDKHDALQFPVFPILEMPTFRNFFRQLTTATYADEFAENHFTILVQRRDMGAFVPCAGTGFALSRRVLESFGDEPALPSESLTEDYLLSLNLYKKGVSLYYVLNKLPRVLPNGKIKIDFITTRSLFPSTFKAAVRQKTRWTYGITMQSIGIRDIFTKEKISLAGRYSFYKDIKSKFLNLLPILGYILAIYVIIAAILHLDPFYTKGSVIYYMSVIVFIIMCLRQITRGYALYSVYGLRSVFFGCLLPPLFPIRLLYGNIINFAAVVRAFMMQIGLRQGKKNEPKKGEDQRENQNEGQNEGQGEDQNEDQKEEHKNEKKKTAKWAKTDHDFLSRDQLRQYRRMLGDVLIVQKLITAAQFRDALNKVDKEHGQQIGTYLIENGIITEEQMLRALGHVKHIQFIPDEIVEKLDYDETAGKYDPDMLREKKLLPLTDENGTMIIAVCNDTSDKDLKDFEESNHLQIKRMYMMEEYMMNAISLLGKKRDQLESLALYHKGGLSYEQVILVGKFASMKKVPEKSMREMMGIMK